MIESGLILPLFAYGTLVDPTFVGRLLEHGVEAEPAQLVDFEMVELPALSYPVVFDSPDRKAPGQLYRHLTAEDYARLDAYEGVMEGLYQRVEAEVIAGGPEAASETPEKAFVYLPTEQTLSRFG